MQLLGCIIVAQTSAFEVCGSLLDPRLRLKPAKSRGPQPRRSALLFFLLPGAAVLYSARLSAEIEYQGSRLTQNSVF